MKSLKVILILIIGYLAIFPSSLSAGLSTAQFEIIKIAYMNGYSNAIQADLNTIKMLKRNKEELKRVSQISVDKYMERVTLLNKEGQRGVNEKKAIYSGSNSLSL